MVLLANMQLFDKIRSESPDVLNKVVPMQGDITEKGMHSQTQCDSSACNNYY